MDSFEDGTLVPIPIFPKALILNLSGTPANTVNVTGLTDVLSVRFSVTLSKLSVTRRNKSLNKMKVLKVEKTTANANKLLYGLTNSPYYGERIEDRELSLGIPDAFKSLSNVRARLSP